MNDTNDKVPKNVPQAPPEAPKNERKALKFLAVAGFIVLILAIAWLSVKIITLMPAALSSLASLADGVYHDRPLPSLSVERSVDSVEAGATLNLRWDGYDTPGTYVLSYACREGVAADIENEAGRRSLHCGTTYDLGDADEVTLRIFSEKARAEEFSYRIGFLRPNDRRPRTEHEGTVVVLNERIPAFAENGDATEAAAPAEGEGEVAGTSTEESVIAPPALRPSIPPPTVEYVYQIPVSDPAGHTDLAVRFLEIGSLVGDEFFPGTAFIVGGQGAVRFEVRNIGTRTSGRWRYTATLPGIEYTSPDQAPLKPNERAMITLGSPTPPSEGVATLSVSIDYANDIDPRNDSFSRQVVVVR